MLARTPLFAHLLARIPKVANQELKAPLALVWQGQPVLLYHPRLLQSLSGYEHWLTDWLCEELLHLLLQHSRLQEAYPIAWAFHLAADLEVRQYWHFAEGEPNFRPLRTRLHLPPQPHLDSFYHAILRLQATVGRRNILPNWSASPLSRLSHQYWSIQFTLADWQVWWAEQYDLQEEFGNGRLGQLLNNLNSHRPGTAQLPWPTLLRRFVTSAQRTQHRNSLRRPSRRFGTMPGQRRRRTAKLAVIIDTSGSIIEEQRQRFFTELQRLKRFTSEILVIEADNQVQKNYRFTNELPPFSQGGGGTSFDAALQFVNTAGPFDGVVYFTDGEGPLPKVNCQYPLLWLVVGQGSPGLSSDWPGQVVCWETIQKWVSD